MGNYIRHRFTAVYNFTTTEVRLETRSSCTNTAYFIYSQNTHTTTRKPERRRTTNARRSGKITALHDDWRDKQDLDVLPTVNMQNNNTSRRRSFRGSFEGKRVCF